MNGTTSGVSYTADEFGWKSLHAFVLTEADGLVVGTNVQAYSAVLDALAAQTDLPVADGGTGASTAAAAAANLAVIPTDGWVADANTWTRASDTSFTLSGAHAARFPKGTKVKYTDTTVKYGVVAQSADNFPTGGTCTVILIPTSDYAMTATPSATYVSPVQTPAGFPHWFNWSPTIVGFSSNPTNMIHRWKADGNQMTIAVRHSTAGTSNATTYTVSLPVNAAAIANHNWSGANGFATDNSANLTVATRWNIPQSSSTVAFFKDMAVGTWTATGTKAATAVCQYEY